MGIFWAISLNSYLIRHSGNTLPNTHVAPIVYRRRRTRVGYFNDTWTLRYLANIRPIHAGYSSNISKILQCIIDITEAYPKCNQDYKVKQKKLVLNEEFYDSITCKCVAFI